MTDDLQPETGEPELEPETGDIESAEDDLANDEAAELAHEGADEADDEPAPRPPVKLERLQKILAQAGIASRRAAEEVIQQGRVQINGQVVTELGTKADPVRDHIRVDGKLLHGAERLRYFMLNKPKGYVTTVKDPEGRPTVMEFFAKTGERLYPVGRLDYLSEGLLLVTNDGELANGLTRAASGVEKTYLVKVAGQPAEDMLERLREGVQIERGRPGEGKVRTAPARIRPVRPGDNPWFEVTLIEGRNRELRKMFEEIGHHVEKIRRVGYGPLVLDVEPGKLRELDPEEVEALRLTAAGKLKPKRVKSTRMLPKEAGISTEQRAARAAKRGGKPFRPRSDREQKPEWKPRSQNFTDRREGQRPQRGAKPGFGKPPGGGFGAKPGFGGPRNDRAEGRTARGESKPGFQRPFRKERTEFQGRTRDEEPRRSMEAPQRRTFRPRGEDRPPAGGRFERPGPAREKFGKSFGKPAERGPAKGPQKSWGDRESRPASSARPPRRDATSAPYRGKGKPAPHGESKPAGKSGFGDKAKTGTGGRAKAGFGGRAKSGFSGRAKSGFSARPGGSSKPGFKGKPGGARRSGPRPGVKRNGERG